MAAYEILACFLLVSRGRRTSYTMISPELSTEPFLAFKRPEATTLSRESPADLRDAERSA